MADELADGGNDAGTSGYVDDDLDLDDDDEVLDAPAVAPSSQETPTASSLPPPDPRDYTLHVAGEAERALVVARFLTGCPDLSPPTRMRMVRDGEEGPDGRREALEKEGKQWQYYRSHVGRERRAIREKQGFTEIPDRDRKKWHLQIVNEDDVRPGAAASTGGAREEGGEEASYFERNPGCTRQFEGSFEGKSSSRYGVLVVDERTRSASIVPVGPYAWFSFRQKRGRRVGAPKAEQSTEGAEKKIRKKAEAGARKLAKYQAKGELAQEAAELGQGSLAGVRAKRENAMVGIHRGRARRAEDGESGREGLDFDEEFANDDVAQVEREEEDEKAPAVERGADYLKKFRQMIKDEDAAVGAVGSRPTSPGGESDDGDDGGGRGAGLGAGSSLPTSPNRRSRPSSPEGHGLPPKGPGAAAAAAAAAAGAGATAAARGGGGTSSRPASERLTPGIASPGPGSVPGTPLREAYAHLLPPPGVLPEDKHVTEVLRAMIAARAPDPVPLKEFTHVFDRSTQAHKKNLMAILKRVAKLVELTPGSKIYFVSLLPGV
jgi:hypothetical protein